MKRPKNKLHSSEVADILGFRNYELVQIIDEWKIPLEKECPGQCQVWFQPGYFCYFWGYWMPPLGLQVLIENLNRYLEECQTGEWIQNAQDFLESVYRKRKFKPRIIFYQVS